MKKSVQLADWVFERLEEDILSGKYETGIVLTETKLSEELGVSRTPLREALNRLKQESLIEEVGKGIKVCSITKQDLLDICDIRLLLEGKVTAMAARNMTDEGLKALRQALDMEEFFTGKNDYVEINRADTAFHQMIYEMSGSKIYSAVLTDLHRRIKRYRRISISTSNRAHNTIAEHNKIYEAIANHDAELADKMAVEHVMRAKENIINFS